MIPALSQVCSLNSPFPRDVEDYAAGQCPALEIWLTKLEQYVESRSPEQARELLAEHGMAAPVASLQGGLLASQGEMRNEAWGLFERRLELCRVVGIGVLVVAGDIAGPISREVVDRVSNSLRQAATMAGDHGIRLALEFQARATMLNNLETAVAVVRETDNAHLGICLDAFHFYVGPSMTEDLRHLESDILFHVQLCDLAGTLRELASDSDRILPGEGDMPLSPVLSRLREIGYQKHVSIEILNPRIWQVAPLQFGEIAMTALRRLLGQANMGRER